jgi:hypothetical protein
MKVKNLIMRVLTADGVVTMKIALGMITKSLDSDAELLRFIENAEKYGHKLDCVITAYTQRLDPLVERSLNRKVPFFAVDIKYPRYCIEQFRRRGISDAAARTLLECPVDTGGGLVPYGFNRTVVVLEAILRGVDVLFFVDSDVYPTVLNMTPGGPVIEETDFFGAHLEHLRLGSQITTGEYSGYNILPPASFDGMDDLLSGLQKAEMIDYWQTSAAHRCLAVQNPERDPKPCTKILGGNTALRLSAFSLLPPFFSPYYTVGDELFLCRGEDTVLGLAVAKNGIICTDIGVNPLHDTYRDYPAEPDLRGDPTIQERFYYACTGWVGRNPFLNYIYGADLQSARERQHESLERGLRALAGYTSNPRFYGVLRNFEVSWDSLGRYISEYEWVLEAWDEIKPLCS